MFSANVTAVSTLLLILEISLIGFFFAIAVYIFTILTNYQRKLASQGFESIYSVNFFDIFVCCYFLKRFPWRLVFSYFCCFWFDIQLAFAAFLPLILLLVTQRHHLPKFVPDMLSINAYNPIIFFLASLSIWVNLFLKNCL